MAYLKEAQQKGHHMTPQEDGLYFDVPEEEYFDWNVASHSGIKLLAQGKTPAHYRAYLDAPSYSSDAQAFGTAVHTAIIEPEKFELVKPLPPSIKRRVGKEWDALQAESPSITFLPPSQWEPFLIERDAALTVRDNVMQNPVARELIENAKGEVSGVWTDPLTGVRCRMRVDLLGTDIIDIKTTRFSSQPEIARSGYKYGYHIQAAMYTDGIKAITGEDMNFWFLFVEKDAPHLVSIFDGHAAYDEIADVNGDKNYLRIGRDKYQRALEEIAECEKTGEWPGYSNEPREMIIPKWAAWEGVV